MNASARRKESGKGSMLIAIGIGALLLSGCSIELYANLPEREANAMVAALKREGISASRVRQDDGQLSVHVDEGKFAEAVQVLERSGLPHRQYQSMGEVFKRDSLVVSPTQERAQMHYALSEELSQTISEIDGVVSARVHVVLPETDPLRGSVQPSSAAVFVRYDENLAIGPLVPRIKSLVVGGVGQLDYSRVSVFAVPVPAAAYGTKPGDIIQFMGLSMTRSSVGRAGWVFGLLSIAAAAFGAVVARSRWTKSPADPYKLTPPR